MKTKSYLKFMNRAAMFEADIELVDVLRIAVDRGALHTSGSGFLFDDVSKTKHPRLAAHASTAKAREIAVVHLKNTVIGSFVKDIYEDAMLYFSSILESAARHGIDPGRLVGEHIAEFRANELLSAGSWPAVVKMVSDSIFRGLESERDTKKLLKKIDTKLGLGVASSKMDAALPYFEIRHLLVHADGIADKKFCKNFPKHGATAGDKLILTNQNALDAQSAISDLILDFDTKVIAKGLVSSEECQP